MAQRPRSFPRIPPLLRSDHRRRSRPAVRPRLPYLPAGSGVDRVGSCGEVTFIFAIPVITTTSTTRRIVWPMTVLTSLFFMWGFITVLNDVLVPHWKKLFDLNYA